MQKETVVQGFFWAILLLLVSPLESVWSKWIQAEETENILEPISSQQGASVWSSKKKKISAGKKFWDPLLD